MNIKKPFLHEISAGGVVFKFENNDYKIAVIKRNKMNDWTLPKGHQEDDESLQETAIREVFEETLIKANITEYIGSFSYSVEEDNKIFRTVHWFLMKYDNSSTKKSDNEIKFVKWLSINKDFSFMTYKNDLRIIKKAIKIISK